MIQYSEKIEALLPTLNYAHIGGTADEVIIDPYDSGDMDGISLFLTGFEFCEKAKGQDVFWGTCGGDSYVFIGSEVDILAKLAKIVAGPEDDSIGSIAG